MTTMNCQQLFHIFKYLEIPKSDYKLGTNQPLDSYETIEHTAQGWELDSTERGLKFSVEIFDNETDACLKMLDDMVHFCAIDKKQALKRHPSNYVDKTCSGLNVRQLRSILAYLKVPETLYRRHWYACSDYYLDMKQTAQGWEVFTCERGVKRDVVVFENETDACLDLLYKVMHL